MASQSQQPVDPSQAQGAQIPLQNFKLPEFPRQAQGLMALTLTSDIKLDDYQELLTQPATVPKLPTSIQSLTLELFSMGYPPGFLTSLIEGLPHIKTLVLYSQLFAGITAESEADAVRFFEKATDLRALHLLDVFSKPSFFEQVGPVLKQKEKGLMFLEVSYSYRHEDDKFLSSIPAAVLPGLISPSLISLSLNMSSPDITNDPDDPTNLEEEGGKGEADGIVVLGEWAEEFVDALVVEKSAPRSLRGLNGTLYSLSLEQLKTVLAKHRGLVVVSATVEFDGKREFKKELREALGGCQSLEQVEVIVNPSKGLSEALSQNQERALESIYYLEEDMDSLFEKCKKLTHFKMSILRKLKTATLEWEKGTGRWKGGIVGATAESSDGKKTEDTSLGKEGNWSPWT